MSILLVVITFVLFMVIGLCLRAHRFEAATTDRQLLAPEKPPARQVVRQNGFEIPSGYCFHPGHTWAVHEGGQIVRIGLDGLAAALIGRIKKIEVTGLHRWVQQGQRVWTVTHNGFSVDMLSPVEGAVVAVNPDVLRDPGIVAADPYRNGWILAVRSPDLKFSLNNLMKGRLVRAWLQESTDRLKEMTSGRTALVAQEGRLAIPGLLARVDPHLRGRIIREFFLNLDERTG